MMDIRKINIGFMGTGGIATALAKGFCSSDGFDGVIWVFDRNEYKMDALKKLYPGKIAVAQSNQEVIDNAKVIFPTLLPAVLRDVAPTLKFSSENHVIHLAAGIKIEEAEPWFVPSASIVRAVPLPFASRRMGPLVYFGNDPLSEELLSLLGVVVKVERERDLEILAAITGMMVPYYALVGETVKWAVSKGIDFESAMKYTTGMNEALSNFMRSDCTEDMESFLVENTTPKGMNELGLNVARKAGVYEHWADALEQIGKHYDL